MTIKLSQFKFVGHTSDGRVCRGSILAETPKEAASQIRLLEIKPTIIRKKSKFLYKLMSIIRFRSVKYHIRQKVKISFYRTMGEMIRAGNLISHSTLYALKQTSCMPLKAALHKTYLLMVQGFVSADAFATMPKKVISKELVSLIRSSEMTGGLGDVFTDLADELDLKMKSTFTAITSLYTQFAIFLGLCYMSREIAVVVRPIMNFHKYMNGYEYDAFTKLYFALFAGGAIKLVLIVFAYVFAFMVVKGILLRFRIIRVALDSIKVRIPGIRSAIIARDVANFCFSFSLALKAGIRFQPSFNIGAKAINNSYLSKNSLELSKALALGFSAETVMARSKLFSREESQIIVAASQSNNPGKIIADIREYATLRIQALTRLKASISKIIIIFLLMFVLLLTIIFGLTSAINLWLSGGL